MLTKYKLTHNGEDFIYDSFWQLRNKLTELLPNTSLPATEETLLTADNIAYISDTFNIDLSTYEIIEPVPSLSAVKENKIAELTADKYAEIKGGMDYEHGGTVYKADTDEAAKTAIIGQLTAFDKGLMQSVDWKFQDYKWITFTKAEFEAFAAQVLEWIEAKFVKERTLIEQVNACTTIAEVNEIKW